MAHHLELTLIDGSNEAPVSGAAVKVHPPDATFSSDDRGIVTVEFSDLPSHVAVWAKKEGYVPKLVAWDYFHLGPQVPERFTVPMERGKSIGGIVRNQAGEPVEGANVLIILRGICPQGVQPRIHYDIWEHPAPTDSAGRWRFDAAPEDISSLSVRLEHPDYISNEHIPNLPPLEEFKNGTAVLTILKGVPCEGTVTDEQGHPLPGVKVICGEDGSDSTSTPTRMTDAAGHFHFGGISLQHRSKGAILSFLKEGYAPELVELQPASTLIKQDVVLRPGKSLRVRFTDSEGLPVKGAIMAVNAWREYRPFHLGFESDETGLAHWEDAPEDPVGFTLMHKSFQYQDVLLTAGDDVQTIVLRCPMKISGTVIDAQTRQPIPAFNIVRGSYYSGRQSSRSHWIFSYVYPYTGGKYQTASSRPVRTMNAKGGPGEEGFHRLRIDAPGYRAAVSRPIANDEENAECNFELEPAAATEGSVSDAESKPLFGASIVVTGAGNPVIVENGDARQRGHFTVTTDERGRYVLPAQEEDFQLIIVHPDSGYFMTTCSELALTPHVKLRPWGRLILSTTAQKDSQPNYYLQPVLERGYREERVHFRCSPVSGKDGTWIFEGLPAGQMRLSAYGQPMDGGPVITIEDGKTARVDFRSGRRIVIGQIILPPVGISTEEPLAHLRLRRKLSPPAMPGGLNEQAQHACITTWRATPEGMKHLHESFEIPFRIDFQGRFQIDDLLPGQYQLVAMFFKSMPTQQYAKQDVVGIGAKDFELPAGDGKFDLGPIDLHPPDDIQVHVHPC